MNPLKSRSCFSGLQIRALLVVALLMSACFILRHEMGIVLGQTQTPVQESEDVPPGQEKKLENLIPEHLPIKVKIKNVNRKKWVHDLEVEVKNTSDKPIYFMLFAIILPDVIAEQNPVGFNLTYGRMQLYMFDTPLEPKDVPIQPGDTYVFKIDKSSAKGWDYLREKKGKPEPKRIRIIFQSINFGDGTGYSDSGGTPVNINKKTSLNRTCLPPNRSSGSVTQTASSFLPASFLPVKFSPAEPLKVALAKPLLQPDVNCPGTSCSFVKESVYVCDRTCDSNPFRPFYQSVGSQDPNGACKVIGSTDNTCYDPVHGPLTCVDWRLYSCSQFGGPENTEERCGDTVDNDGDGTTDCVDSDCAFTNRCGRYGPPCPSVECNEGGNGQFPVDYCTFPLTGCPPQYNNLGACCGVPPSPIIIDVDGSGFYLTSASDGVPFDFFGTGNKIKISWTAFG